MTNRIALVFIVIGCSLSPSLANDEVEGTLNPDEMSLSRNVQKALEGDVNFVTCASGYLMTKKGDHASARIVFEECARKGYTRAMTWMSYLDDNGFGAKENAERASEWDRKAAEMGDPVAQFNYGLDLLRGRGVQANSKLARDYVDRAASAGLKDAVALQQSGYDYRSVTPDADEWKYAKPAF